MMRKAGGQDKYVHNLLNLQISRTESKSRDGSQEIGSFFYVKKHKC
jgi:hypothetical protein